MLMAAIMMMTRMSKNIVSADMPSSRKPAQTSAPISAALVDRGETLVANGAISALG
jgi:hypothetical protein